MAGWASAQTVFSSSFSIAGVSIRVTVLWWLLFTAVATYVLFKTRIGNWISPSAVIRKVPARSVCR